MESSTGPAVFKRATPVRRNPRIPCRSVDGRCALKVPSTAAVVVVCHNYGRFLAECLESVLTQSHRAMEILVVDDASDDDSSAVAESFRERGVQYVRVEHRNVHQARCVGMASTRAEVLCFLDADDKLEVDYLKTGLAAFQEPNVAVVYSDLKKFGDVDGKSSLPNAYQRERLAADNFIHAGSLVRREALVQSRAFESPIDPLRTQADWFLWRRILSGSWKGRKQSAAYLYRQHSANWTHAMRQVAREYFEYAGLAHETITLFIPLSGRLDAWRDCAAFLAQQTWPHSQMRLMLADTSGNPQFSAEVRQWLATCDYPDVRHIQVSVARPGLADENRHREEVKRDVRLAMARIYHLAAAETITDYVWILEDDVVPALDVCQRLLHGFDSQTASVSAVYCSRFDQQPCVWDQHRQHYYPVPAGLRAAHGNGFGCVILRGGVLRDAGFRHEDDFDRVFYDQLSAAGWISKVDWGARCRHGHLAAPAFEGTTTGCSCPVNGWCERHQCRKTEHWWHLCRTRADYFALWERGCGPGQNLGQPPEGEPGMLRKAWNLGNAVVRHVADGGQDVDGKIYLERLEICRDCPSCDVARMVCKEPDCGCQLHTKARWRSERCPRGKWPELVVSPRHDETRTGSDSGLP